MSQFFIKNTPSKPTLFGCASDQTMGNRNFRFNDKNNLQGERMLVSNYYDEYVNLNGWKIKYYVMKFDFTKADMFYGEDPLAKYEAAQDMIALVQLDEGNVSLARFGFNPEDAITMTFTINQFNQVFRDKEYFLQGREVSPKAGDIVSLDEYGNTRFGNRGPKLFEITQVLDTNIKENINQFGFQYVWQIRAKRFDYSYENTIPPEKGSTRAFEDKMSITDLQNAAILSAFDGVEAAALTATAKPYNWNVDDSQNKTNIEYKNDIDDVYGGY